MSNVTLVFHFYGTLAWKLEGLGEMREADGADA